MIRVKFTAIYLGPFGVGLFGAYNTILGPLAILAGLGMSTSGVRQIAEAVGMGDQEKVARSLLTVRRCAWISGLIGILLMLALAYPLALSVFGNAEHVLPLCVLSLTLLMGSLAAAFGAIIQGMRRIRDLAAQGILGSILSLPIAIPMMMLWGVKALVPMMLASSIVSLILAWWFARRIPVAPVRMTWRETWLEARPMLQLGVVLMGTALMAAGTSYLLRIIIIRKLGLEANGIYSSALNLSGYYIGFILGAMGADFYPRLTAVHQDNAEVNRLVNEQTEVGMLIALPGIIATLTLAPMVIMLFYTSAFMPAVDVLRWQTLGLMLRLASWPMAFIMLAKGEKKWYFWTELAANILLLGFMWLGVHFYGLVGTGIASFALYIVHVLMMLCVSKRMSGFFWERANLKIFAWTALLLTITTLAVWNLPVRASAVIGVVLALITGWFSLKTLTRLTGNNPLLSAWNKVISQIRPKADPG
jgi:PST family polysaccharide transporter